ncbi:MAG: glycosyltransferase family 2 protein [Treponema sp.]|nr:glycosyltransferase family 2 protein [Treponema sp.]
MIYENNDLISVIINVYNGEKYIDKCLKSVIDQTYKNLEIIIVNDGSTDNTLEIVKKYKDERIRIIDQENMGLSLSRNVGIDNAHGEWLFFVDADDFVTTDVIEYLYDIAKKKNVLISACKTLVINNYDYTLTQEPDDIKLLSARDMIKKIFLSLDRAGSVWNKLIKKELFNNIRFEARVINDVVVVYKLYLEAVTIAFGNRITYFYLLRPDSITGLEREEHSKDYYLGARERYEYVKRIYPKFWENEICMYFSTTDTYLYRNDNIRRFLAEVDAFKYYNKIFKFRTIFHKMSFAHRIKYISFRINPKFCLLLCKILQRFKIHM